MPVETMKNYQHPLWSRFYDLMHSGDSEDLDFYLREALNARGPVLEVACGTGRILLPMLRRSVDAWGIDISQPMLDRLREKAQEMGLAPKVIQADMRDFCLNERFSLIIVPFRSFLHLETREDQISTLTCLRKHLAPDGHLILNFLSPSSLILAERGGSLPLVRHFVDPASGRVIRAWQVSRNDPSNQRQTIDWVLQEVDEGGQIVGTMHSRLDLRWIYKAEFVSLLEAAGYSHWDVYGGFNGELLEREDQEMVWVAWP